MNLRNSSSPRNSHFLFVLPLNVFLLLTQSNPCLVGADLLVHSERETNSAGKDDTLFNFMTQTHVSSSEIREPEILQELELYRDFIGSFSEFRQWETAKLIFPQTVVPGQCDFLRGTLLRTVGLQTTCSPNQNNTNPIKKTGKSKFITPRNDDPVIFLHFLSTSSQDQITQPDFLTKYETAQEIIILAGNVSRDVILKEFRPENDSNYKWTLASTPSIQDRKNRDAELIIEIEDIFGFATSPEPIPHYLGFWSRKEGVQIEKRKLLGLSNFQGKLIRITSVEGNPVVYLHRNTTSGKLRGSGYLPDILDSLSLHLNFKYVLLEPKDKSFGLPDPSGNGSWSGMVGMLLRKEAEMALMSFSYTAQRKQVMDFSPPVERSSTRLLIRRDFDVSELKWESFVSPFHWHVWFAIPVTILLGVVTLMILTQYDLLDMTPVTSACLLFCCFLQQGMEGHSYFRKFPSRIVLGSFWILAVVIYASYTARLTSFLAATIDPLPFKSLFDAVQNRNWKVGLVAGASFRDRVKESPEPEMKIFSKSLDEDASRFVSGFRDGVEKVYNEKYIFFTSDLVPSFMIKGNCSFTWIPGKYFPGFGYMGYQKNLPYAAAISHRVAQIRESGQMSRLLKKWWGVAESCSKGNEAFVGMSLYETGTAFLIIIAGLSLALFFFAGEIVYRPKQTFNQSADDLRASQQNDSHLDSDYVDFKRTEKLPNSNAHFDPSKPRVKETPRSNESRETFSFQKSEYSDSQKWQK